MGKVGEYRMKRVWIAVISVLAAALIGVGAWFFLSESRQQAQIEAEHDAVFTEYERLLRSAEGSTLSVFEGGKEIGTSSACFAEHRQRRSRSTASVTACLTTHFTRFRAPTS